MSTEELPAVVAQTEAAADQPDQTPAAAAAAEETQAAAAPEVSTTAKPAQPAAPVSPVKQTDDDKISASETPAAAAAPVEKGVAGAQQAQAAGSSGSDGEDVNSKRLAEDDTKRNWAITTEYIKKDANLTLDEKQRDVMERLIKVRSCKRQVLDMLEQIKANKDTQPPSKEMLNKLLTSFDGFKEQEENYLEILKQILNIRKAQAVTASRDAKEVAHEMEEVKEAHEQMRDQADDDRAQQLINEAKGDGDEAADDETPGNEEMVRLQELIKKRDQLKQMLEEQHKIREAHKKKVADLSATHDAEQSAVQEEVAAAKALVAQEKANVENKRRQLDELKTAMGSIRNMVGQMDNTQIHSDLERAKKAVDDAQANVNANEQASATNEKDNAERWREMQAVQQRLADLQSRKEQLDSLVDKLVDVEHVVDEQNANDEHDGAALAQQRLLAEQQQQAADCQAEMDKLEQLSAEQQQQAGLSSTVTERLQRVQGTLSGQIAPPPPSNAATEQLKSEEAEMLKLKQEYERKLAEQQAAMARLMAEREQLLAFCHDIDKDEAAGDAVAAAAAAVPIVDDVEDGEERQQHAAAIQHLNDEKHRLLSMKQQFDEFQKELNKEMPQLNEPIPVRRARGGPAAAAEPTAAAAGSATARLPPAAEAAVQRDERLIRTARSPFRRNTHRQLSARSSRRSSSRALQTGLNAAAGECDVNEEVAGHLDQIRSLVAAQQSRSSTPRHRTSSVTSATEASDAQSLLLWQQQQMLTTALIQQQVQMQQMEMQRMQHVINQYEQQSVAQSRASSRAAHRHTVDDDDEEDEPLPQHHHHQQHNNKYGTMPARRGAWSARTASQFDGRPLSSTSLANLFAPLPAGVGAHGGSVGAVPPLNLSTEDEEDEVQAQVYDEVAALISAHEHNPRHLLNMFKQMQHQDNSNESPAAVSHLQRSLQRHLVQTDRGGYGRSQSHDTLDESDARNSSSGSRPNSARRSVLDKANAAADRARVPRERVRQQLAASARHVNMPQLEQQVESVIEQLVPLLKDANISTCDAQLLLYVRKLCVTLAVNKCLPGESRDSAVCQQMGHLLDDALAKYNGHRLPDVCEQLVVDVSEVMFNELAFQRLMRAAPNTSNNQKCGLPPLPNPKPVVPSAKFHASVLQALDNGADEVPSECDTDKDKH